MEALYSKLYDKYTKLKRKNYSELDEQNKEQEVKFINCVSAAEELIEHLRKENQRLRAQVNESRKEFDSISSSEHEQLIKYQNQLMEEYQKNKALSEEMEQLRMQKMQIEGLLCYIKESETVPSKTSKGDQVIPVAAPNGSASNNTRKRRKHLEAEAEDHPLVGETGKDLSREIIASPALRNLQQPECCHKTTHGDHGNDNSTLNCVYQSVVECLVGMKLSIVSQSKRTCISALHLSSGYSFSLTWTKRAGKETDLLYHLLSLGTFERIAPEWMREDIMFGMNMCPIFFQRVSRFIRLNR